MATKNTSAGGEARSFLVQIYFVLATLIGLILIVISGVNVSRLVLNELLGVEQYPSFGTPYPPYKDPGLSTPNAENLTTEDKEALEEWKKEYEAWQQKEREYNSEDQNRRRQIAESLAMLIVGVPVFAIHAPYVFKRS
jgi:Lon protease-like protein